MTNNQFLDNQVLQEPAAANQDASVLVGGRAVQFGQFEDEVSQAKDRLSAWMENGVVQMSESLNKIKSTSKERGSDMAAAMKKDIERGLSQFNTNAQQAADKVPGAFARKAARYPWVTLSITLMVGFMLGRFLYPVRQPHKLPQVV